MDSYNLDRSYALGLQWKGIYQELAYSPMRPGRVQTRIPIPLNRRRPLQVALWFFLTRPPSSHKWYEWPTLANTHIFPRARTPARSARAFPSPREKGALFFSENWQFDRRSASRRVALRRVTCRLTLYCRGNGHSATVFHSNIAV